MTKELNVQLISSPFVCLSANVLVHSIYVMTWRLLTKKKCNMFFLSTSHWIMQNCYFHPLSLFIRCSPELIKGMMATNKTTTKKWCKNPTIWIELQGARIVIFIHLFMHAFSIRDACDVRVACYCFGIHVPVHVQENVEEKEENVGGSCVCGVCVCDVFVPHCVWRWRTYKVEYECGSFIHKENTYSTFFL